MCKSKYSAKNLAGSILSDYSIVLDKNGIPSHDKIAKFINLNCIEDLKSITGLETNDINTLLYGAIYKDKGFVPRYCCECNKFLNIAAFPGGYRDSQRFCSYDCKDKNSAYLDILRVDKINVSRYENESYMRNKMVPWFSNKCKVTKETFDVEVLTSLDEYVADKTKINYKCISCDYTFTKDFSFNRSLFCKFCNPSSKPQGELSKYIRDFGLTIQVDCRTQLDKKEIDIYIPDKNIGIEYDGFYWHNDNDNSDKYELADSRGIRLIKIFEDEFKNKKPIVLSRIKSILGFIDTKIYARKCEIKQIDYKTSAIFFDRTHIQGSTVSSIQYGLYYNDKLVACMSFGKPRFNKDYDYELIRYSSELDLMVVGGASKLFTEFRKKFSGKSVISYCDLRYGTGKLYDNLGFDFLNKTSPGYFYYKKGKRYSRVKFQKHKLVNILEYFDENESESVNMNNNGYLKIWDLGHKVYGIK